MCVLLACCLLLAVNSQGQTFTLLEDFNVTNGSSPEWITFAQGTDGNIYGTPTFGGASGEGLVFKLTPDGTFTTVHNFDGADGWGPTGQLLLTTAGSFYGITMWGGSTGCGGSGCGTIFKMTAKGKVKTLHSFSGPDGEGPLMGLVQGSDGDFYGTTGNGGDGAGCPYGNGCGAIFKMSAAGKLTTIYSFCSQLNCPDGQWPDGFILGSDGDFYGVTSGGGANDGGTVFKISPQGALTTLYSFCAQAHCADGGDPTSSLVQGADGNFYGTTEQGGNIFDGGTVFRITPAGELTTLYSFCSQSNCPDGAAPASGPLVQAADGNFYGVTETGGSIFACYGYGCGTVFKITPAGTLTTLHSFDYTDGLWPFGGLFQATNGKFYGTTNSGGINNDCVQQYSWGCGTAFSVDVGLAPFVQTQPTFGKAKKKVIILGNNLTGATSVSFNGTTAAFKVVSSTEITATVPKGATTGYVTVTTPGGTLTSNVQFRIP